MMKGDILLTKDLPLALRGTRKMCNAHAPRAVVLFNGATCPFCDTLAGAARVAARIMTDDEFLPFGSCAIA